MLQYGDYAVMAMLMVVVTMAMVMMAMSDQSNKLPFDPGAKEEIYHSLTLAKTSKEQHGDDDGDGENIVIGIVHLSGKNWNFVLATIIIVNILMSIKIKPLHCWFLDPTWTGEGGPVTHDPSVG